MMAEVFMLAPVVMRIRQDGVLQNDGFNIGLCGGGCGRGWRGLHGCCRRGGWHSRVGWR